MNEWNCSCGIVFFFQAEDGIRDLTVTGVQTCALPISVQDQHREIGFPSGACTLRASTRSPSKQSNIRVRGAARLLRLAVLHQITAALCRRSEERRVGEECRSRGSADHLKKKKKQVRDE